MTNTQGYLEPTQNAGRQFFSRGIVGSVVMLNLLRFREVADYSAHPELAPASTMSGAEAYRLYMDHIMAFLRASGGDVLFVGNGGPLLIGPEDERWDLAILVLQSIATSFLAFADHKDYLSGLGHRTAALEDSRLLPLTDWKVTSGRAGLPG